MTTRPDSLVRVATWNLDWWQRSPRLTEPSELIAEIAADVVALHEVRGVRALRAAHPGVSLFSQELYEPAKLSWMGCAILLPPETAVIEAGVIETLPKPQRAIWARAALQGGTELTVVSWHAPNKAGDGLETKMDAYKVVSEWLTDAPRPLVLGVDLNTWRDPVQLIEPEPGEPHFQEHAFVGPRPAHGLADAYRQALEAQGELAPLRDLRPNGPLEVSHVLSDGAEHRMDRIFISPELRGLDGGYELARAKKAGSDHALHWVDLESVQQ